MSNTMAGYLMPLSKIRVVKQCQKTNIWKLKITYTSVQLLNHGVVGILVRDKKGSFDVTAVGILVEKKIYHTIS